MAQGMRPRFVLLVIGCLAVAACTPGGGSPAPSATPGRTTGSSSEVAWGPCPADYLVAEPDDSFDPKNVDCATVAVPATYDGASALPDFGIAMMRIRSTAKGATLGTLFVNPGGPGGSGIEEVQHQAYPAAIRDTYDIVGFDPRGVLHSQPLVGQPIRCSDELDFSSYWLLEMTPDNQAEIDASQKLNDDYIKDCEKNSPAWWTLGTENVVRDLDLLRERVTGDEPLNFLGSSYGTTIAASYVRTYPKHNGHIILDSPTDNSSDSAASQLAQTRAVETSVLRLVDGYAKARHLTRGQVEADLQKIRQWGDDDQLLGYLGLKPSPDEPGARISSEYAFVHGIFALTYFDVKDAQPAFNSAVDDLLKQKWNGVFEYFSFQLDGYDTDAMYDAYKNGKAYDESVLVRDDDEILMMVNGIDRDQRDLSSHAEQDALAEKLRRAAPFTSSLERDATDFRTYVPQPGNTWSWEAVDDPAIPDPPKRDPKRENRSGHPVMVIGSLHESTTPYPFAVKTAKDLKSVLITWTGTEHAPLAGFQHPCLNDLLVDYLVHDKLPRKPVTCKA